MPSGIIIIELVDIIHPNNMSVIAITNEEDFVFKKSQRIKRINIWIKFIAFCLPNRSPLSTALRWNKLTNPLVIYKRHVENICSFTVSIYNFLLQFHKVVVESGSNHCILLAEPAGVATRHRMIAISNRSSIMKCVCTAMLECLAPSSKRVLRSAL